MTVNRTLRLAFLLAAVFGTHIVAADDMRARLATCQDSWLDWNSDPARSQKFADAFVGDFVRTGKDGAWNPKSKQSLLGLPIKQAFPENVGMAVGFSAVVTASFEASVAAFEKALGKKLKDCDDSEGMRMCGLELEPKRTVMVMSVGKPPSQETLVGCYYFYAK
jgi:hypothetical protein